MQTRKIISLFSIVFITLIFSNIVKAQSGAITKTDSAKTERPENIYAEAGSAGLFFSLNYDTRFSNQRDGLGGRIGIGTWSSGGSTFVTAPLQLNYLLGAKSNFLELGAGATLLTTSGNYYGNPLLGGHFFHLGNTVLPTTTIGYRHQPTHNGINFGISFNPMLLEGTFVPYFGGSLGYTFR